MSFYFLCTCHCFRPLMLLFPERDTKLNLSVWRFCKQNFKLCFQTSSTVQWVEEQHLQFMALNTDGREVCWIPLHLSSSSYLLLAQRKKEKRQLYSDNHVFLHLQSNPFSDQQKREAEGHCLADHVGSYKLTIISTIMLQLGYKMGLHIALLSCYINSDPPEGIYSTKS